MIYPLRQIRRSCRFLLCWLGNGAIVAAMKVQGHVHQSDEHRHLHQRTNHRRKRLPELIPKTATATAMANSKLLLAAVNDTVAFFE